MRLEDPPRHVQAPRCCVFSSPKSAAARPVGYSADMFCRCASPASFGRRPGKTSGQTCPTSPALRWAEAKLQTLHEASCWHGQVCFSKHLEHEKNKSQRRREPAGVTSDRHFFWVLRAVRQVRSRLVCSFAGRQIECTYIIYLNLASLRSAQTLIVSLVRRPGQMGRIAHSRLRLRPLLRALQIPSKRMPPIRSKGFTSMTCSKSA